MTLLKDKQQQKKPWDPYFALERKEKSLESLYKNVEADVQLILKKKNQKDTKKVTVISNAIVHVVLSLNAFAQSNYFVLDTDSESLLRVKALFLSSFIVSSSFIFSKI